MRARKALAGFVPAGGGGEQRRARRGRARVRCFQLFSKRDDLGVAAAGDRAAQSVEHQQARLRFDLGGRTRAKQPLEHFGERRFDRHAPMVELVRAGGGEAQLDVAAADPDQYGLAFDVARLGEGVARPG